MKAALFHDGRPSLSVEDIADPIPLPGSAVVEVPAAPIGRSFKSWTPHGRPRRSRK
jgi:hypothetical protein